MVTRNRMQWWDYLSIILLIIGGLNWGLVGFFDFNLVEFLFGESILTTIVYALVFISAIYTIFWFFISME